MRLVEADHLRQPATEQITDRLKADGAGKLNSSKDRRFRVQQVRGILYVLTFLRFLKRFMRCPQATRPSRGVRHSAGSAKWIVCMGPIHAADTPRNCGQRRRFEGGRRSLLPIVAKVISPRLSNVRSLVGVRAPYEAPAARRARLQGPGSAKSLIGTSSFLLDSGD